MTHDEGVAVFAAACVYAREREQAEIMHVPPDLGYVHIEEARRELALACGLPDNWGDSDEAMAALGVAQLHALYPVEEAVGG